MKQTQLILIVIILFFLFTRLYKITEIPPSLYWDEASIGYNAYSVSLDGKDEWGDFLPVHFRAFGEFKLPIYIYTSAVFSKLFGLNPLSVRLPAVLFSLITGVLIYLITSKITKKDTLGILAIFIFFTSPWGFIFSRSGYEATVGLMFFYSGVYLFLCAIEKNKSLTKNLFLILSSLGFVFTFYSYNSFRVITPLTLMLLGFLIYKYKLINSKYSFFGLLACIGLLVIGFFPVVRFIILEQESSRLAAVSIFNKYSSFTEIISHFLVNYISHINLNFLFFSGDNNLRSLVPGFGQLFLVNFPFLVLGFYQLIKLQKNVYILIGYLFFISFIPAAITIESPHSLRSITALPVLSIIIAIGFGFILQNNKLKILLPLFMLFNLLLFVSFFINFLSNYPKKASSEWQYGYRNALISYQDKFNVYDHIIFSDKYGQPYIFFLYYLKIPPSEFRNSVEYNSPDKWGYSLVKKIGKFEFDNFDSTKKLPEKSLIFVHPDEFDSTIEPFDKVFNFDGSIAFYVYET